MKCLHLPQIIKLKLIHLFSPSKANMHVKNAAHTLSNTVAKLIRCFELLNSNNNFIGAEKTFHVVAEVDEMFNWMNGPANKRDEKKNQRTFVTLAYFQKKVKEMVFKGWNGKKVSIPGENSSGKIAVLGARIVMQTAFLRIFI